MNDLPFPTILTYLESLSYRTLYSHIHLPRCQCASFFTADLRPPPPSTSSLRLLRHLTYFPYLLLARRALPLPDATFPALSLTLRPFTHLTLFALNLFVLWLKMLSILLPFPSLSGLEILIMYKFIFCSGSSAYDDSEREANESSNHK